MNFDRVENWLKKYNCNFFHIHSTQSTMEEAKSYLEKNQSNLIVLADEQKMGRGRRGSKWISLPGNIYCSIALNTEFPLDKFFLFSIITLVSIKNSLSKLGVGKIKFKWPNDIFFENKKLGGMILEPYHSKINKDYVIIGLGLNFSSSPSIKNYNTTYIQKLTSIENKMIFCEIFFNNFFYNLNNYLKKKKTNIILEFKESLMYLNQKIEIILNDKKNIIGTFKGINNDGSLILDNGDKLISIYSGSIKI